MSEATVRPPRPELIALLDAVKYHPDEDTPRLVLADWLDEQDNALDAGCAKYIRIAVAAERDGKEARTVAGDLPLDWGRRWLGPVVALGTVRFARGLPVLYVEALRLLRPDATALLASEAFAFVQFLHFDQTSESHMEKVAALPAFRYVCGFEITPLYGFGDEPTKKVFGSPHLTGLRIVDCYRPLPGNAGAAGVQALANNPALSRLRKLSLRHNTLSDAAVGALAGSPHLANLTSLNLSDNNIGDAGAAALAASATLANLRELDLRENPRLTERGKQALRDRFGDRAKLG